MEEERKIKQFKKAKNIAKSRGGELLSEGYINNRSLLVWKCKNGHIWKANFDLIQRGSWCPNCSSGLYERICRCYFEQIFNKPFIKVKPEWLINSRNNIMELDGYCEKLKLAFEHNGRQHYNKKSKWSHNLELRKEDDQKKIELCKERGITLIVIPELIEYIAISSLRSFIKKELIKQNYKIPEGFDNKDIDLSSCYLPGEIVKYENLKKLALNKGIELLSPTYLGVHSDHEWKCNVCDYVWLSRPHNMMMKKGWCPKCNGKARPSIEEILKEGVKKGGECLSPEEYVNGKTKLKWRCRCGYIWRASFWGVKHAGNWCPKCAKQIKPSREYIESLAAKKGGKCLNAEEYINSSTKNLKMQCKDGHEWLITYVNLYGGRWCPVCKNTKRKKTPIDGIKELAEKKGGKCLSEGYEDRYKKLLWKCEKGHVWEALYYSVKAGHWCPKCHGNAKPSAKEIKELAKKKGGKCLNPKEYINYYEKNLKWKCKNGHIWLTCYDAIKKNRWCLICRKGKSEKYKT